MRYIHTFYWRNFSQIIVLNNNSNELFDYGMGIRSRRQKIFDKNEAYFKGYIFSFKWDLCHRSL